jgi:hypothetical protein
MTGDVAQVLEGSGPTIAGGERSEPPVQSSGREPGEPASLFKIKIEAERASASAEAPASAEARCPKSAPSAEAQCLPRASRAPAHACNARCRTARPPDRGPWSGAVSP